jgi:hypothetical protein
MHGAWLVFVPKHKAPHALYIILAPALLLALVYLGLGLRPAPRAIVGVLLFAALAWFLFGRKKKPRTAPPTLPPGSGASGSGVASH